ncbi:hypothetical protein DFQ26_001386 [Actinomortierella ambigua]|nr:hypothetical protein DFQ26_001386 [Actinomortierella ambigua]
METLLATKFGGFSLYEMILLNGAQSSIDELPRYPFKETVTTKEGGATTSIWSRNTMDWKAWLEAADDASLHLPDRLRAVAVSSRLNTSSRVWFEAWWEDTQARGRVWWWRDFRDAFEEEHSKARTFDRALEIIQREPHVTDQESAADYLKRVEREFLMVPWESFDQFQIMIPQNIEERIVRAVIRHMEVVHPVRRVNGIDTWVKFVNEVDKATAKQAQRDRTKQMKKVQKDKVEEPVKDFQLGKRVIPAATWQEFEQDVGKETLKKIAEDEGVAAFTEMFDWWTLMVQVGSTKPKIKRSMDKMAEEFSRRRMESTEHTEIPRSLPGTALTYQPRPKICFQCGAPGHTTRRCPLATCYRCRGTGHIARDCWVDLSPPLEQ